MTYLLGTAAVIGLFHTLLGPDHYLPFIAMAKARRWSTAKTALVTLACGIGHVASSVALGMIGIAAGLALHVLELAESIRGEYAAWLLTAFALATISTMLAVVMLATLGLNFLPASRMQKYSHALAGAVIFLCGAAIHMGL